MEVFDQIGPLKAFLHDKRAFGKSIGLVLTMGALHKGHLSLINTSRKENDLTVSSIFVNPTQFNNPEDLKNYPRTIESDIKLLQEAGCDALFRPENQEMYATAPQLSIDFGALGKVMEGAFRPGHFSGVALVVAKFFNIIAPDTAYFGQKDWQQFVIIKAMVDELKFDLKLTAVPIAREESGLAMSSRNLRLNDMQRGQAAIFFKALTEAKMAIRSGQSIQTTKERVKALVEQEAEVKLEYFEVADSANLNLLDNVEGIEKPIMCIAGYVGKIRLIDNMFLDL